MSVAKKAVVGATITYPADVTSKGYIASFDLNTKKMIFREIPNNVLSYPPGSGGHEFHFTSYPTGGHDAWTRAYNSTVMWGWMFNQRRK